MKVYFLRHGIAADPQEWKGSDDDRPLTRDGIARMEREAKAIADIASDVEVIVTSPLLRARQTADAVADRLGMTDKLVEDTRIAHGFNAARCREIIAEHAGVRSIMLVGHEPTLSATIEALAGEANLELKKGALACVELADAYASGILTFLIPPKVLAALGKR